ncbi:MAG: N-6 DNA methylase [Methylotenera sp.]|nr:N-6 DNA methylase [Methylotenera sp.]
MKSSKLKGKFYTPQALAEWIVFYISHSMGGNLSILEPSCGDGIFINAIDKSASSVNSLDAVEIEDEAITKVQTPTTIPVFTISQSDFLFWETAKTYDLVIGNPPYIVRKLLEKVQADQCKKIHTQHELLDHEVANIWTSFLLKSSDFLKETGVMAFVLPTEILQVKYAEEIREFLSKTFQRLEIITFNQLAFDDIEQDTVVLIAYKNIANKDPGIYITEHDSVADLKDLVPDFVHLPVSSISQKWTTGILKEEDIVLVERLSNQLSKSSDYCESAAGIVTGANSYFIVNQSTLKSHKLSYCSKKIIQKGHYVNGCVDFDIEKFNSLVARDVPCYLLDTNNKSLSKSLLPYLEKGSGLEIPKRFKCKIRKRWHDVPNIKKDEGFFFKRSHDYPKCIKNSADVYVTDSAYQIKMQNGYTIENFIFSFYNSLTLLAAEMQGRYYGGGVLELTPNEFKNLPIPYTDCENFTEFAESFEKKSNIDEILKANDQIILHETLGISTEDITRIQLAYRKMKYRRMRTKL